MLLGFSALNTTQAQTVYGNEWINYSQTYYKIKVVNNGLHRLGYSYLDSLGLSGVNPKELQLFRRGKEVSIYVAGEDDGRLDAQDYLEFYGERNNGELDSELYKNPAHQPHQLYSVYTDTATYFLTFSPAGGKRMHVVNPAKDGLTAQPNVLQKIVRPFTDNFYAFKFYGENRLPWLDEGEGFYSFETSTQRDYTISGLTNIDATGIKPTLELTLAGQSAAQHKVEIAVVAPSGSVRVLDEVQFNAYEFRTYRYALEPTELNTNLKIRLTPKNSIPNGAPDRVSITYYKVYYNQRSIFSGTNLFFYTDTTKASNHYYEFAGAPGTVVAYDITDQGQIMRLEGHVNATNRKGFVLSHAASGNQTRRILLANTAKVFTVKPAERVVFRNIQPAAHNYIVITHKKLMQRVGSAGLPAPQEYAAYRASAAGGGYDTLVMPVDLVIDQFHYGDFSSNAIRRFMKFMGSSPRGKSLFIIGKGREYYGAGYRRSKDMRGLDLIPTGIVPASDLFFTADFTNSNYVPEVPVGRLSVVSAQEVINYLNKVKEAEAVNLGQEWQKTILQLGGGMTNSEINLFTSYLKRYKQIAEGPLLGANVKEKYRQNVSEVVENINIAEEVNTGVSLITFFGHSSSSTSDLDIGLASSAVNGYNNKGKYPFILMNGCGSGNAFTAVYNSFGEDWLKTPDKGAIGFIAHTEIGYTTYLDRYSTNFYLTAFQDPEYYGKSIGLIQQEVIKDVLAANTSENIIVMALCMALQGDPAVKLYSPSKPDYLFETSVPSIVSTNGGTITATAESFLIRAAVKNLGKAITDSINVSVKRTLADNTTTLTTSIKVAPIFYQDTLLIPIDNKGVAAMGINNFEVMLDNTESIDELQENNNIARFQYFFPSAGLMALSPMRFGIVNEEKINVVAQSTQLQADQRRVYFELDTTLTFKSPLKKTYLSNTGEVLPTWKVALPLVQSGADSTVFYWRARFETYATGEDTVWAESSFRYIKGGSNGWSQSHGGQFAKNSLRNIEVKEEGVQWNFNKIFLNLEIRTLGGGGNNRYTQPPYGIFINGASELQNACGNFIGTSTARMYFIVYNNLDLTAVTSIPDQIGCTAQPHVFEFGDMNNTINQARAQKFLESIPDNYYVIAVSVNKVPFNTFLPELKAAFKGIGSRIIDDLQTGYPFAIVGQKGAAPGTAIEVTAVATNETPAELQSIVLKKTLQANQVEGSITSTLIGPAQSWGTLHHNIERQGSGNDAYTLSVIGINAEGEEQTLVEQVSGKSYDLSGVDAKQYPTLQLKASVSDTENRTAPQLKQWMVYYEAVPEGVIRPDLVKVSEEILSEQASRGSITVPMAFQNITSIAFKDSIVVEVTVSGDGLQPTVSRFKIAPLQGNQTAYFNYSMPTRTFDGNYRLSLFVNPRVQAEQQYHNNIYEVPFRVNAKLHPVLDVAFDGVHIMDGELVSPSPLISITVKDENKHDFLKDPSTMSVILINGEEEHEISLMDNPQEVRFYPADEKNDFKLEYKPERLENGNYTLEVRARDVVGKASGISPYRINFMVENESKITNFYPFPNPFSTKTQFIFTLTGSTIPQNMKIQILTITGKVVKEIMKEEMGPLRIGNNKTAYAWDGTDTYGDKLANGVYLYRVVMTQEEEKMQHMWKKGDKAFKNGYGKLYILR
nr:C25 family cysteine peptidase [Pontibacter ruber]